MADLSRDFWIRETGAGQQVAQLHDRYMMMMMMMMMIMVVVMMVVVVVVVMMMMMMMTTYVGIHVQYQLLLLDFNEPRISSTDFRKILKNQIS